MSFLKEVFQTRLEHLRKIIFNEENNLNLSSIIIFTSKENQIIFEIEDNIFQWLFSHYSLNSFFILTKERISIYVNNNKEYEFFLNSQDSNFNIIIHNHEENENNIIKEIRENLKQEKLIGCSSIFYNKEIFNFLNLKIINFELEEILISHQDGELSRIRNAGRVADKALQNVFKPLMERYIEEGDIIGLRSLSEETNNDLNNPEKINPKLNPNDVIAAYPPVISSGYSINCLFPPTQIGGNLTYDIISCSIGIKFKSYIACVGRTFLINSEEYIKLAYKNLVKSRDLLIKFIEPNITFEEIYNNFYNNIEEKYQKFIPEIIGYYCGINLYSKEHCIKFGSKEKLINNSTIILHLSLENVQIENYPSFSLFLTDTIQITNEGTIFITQSKSKYKLIAYTFEDTNSKNKINELLNDNRSIVERTRNRSGEIKKNKNEEHLNIIKEMIPNNNNNNNNIKDNDNNEFLNDNNFNDNLKPISYQNQREIPEIKISNRIAIHSQKYTICLPILGTIVPFHISNISSVKSSSTSDGKISTLIIKFEYPKIKDDSAKNIFIKELIFNMNGNNKFNEISKQISELRNRFVNTQRKRQVDREVYINEEIKLVTGRPSPRLSGGIRLRPALTGKKSIGTLEGHINGFRFRTTNGETLLIMYNNIKFAYLQRASTEPITLIHFLLHKPIKIGKNAEYHITFFKQIVNDIDLSIGHSNMMTDQAEMAEEEHDRRLRKKINKEFLEFCESIENPENKFINSPHFEQPRRQLVFSGVYIHQVSNFYPLMNALVSVAESSSLILLIKDVEIILFERVQLSLKYFDLVFLLKDWSKEVIQITQIPTNYIELIKDWLKALNVKFFVRGQSIEWKEVMNELNKTGRKKFEEEGGWDSFFEVESEDYTSSEEFQESSSAVEYDNDDDEEFGDEVVDEYEDEGYEKEIVEDSSEEGKDWRQLDEEAEEHDRRKEIKDSRHSKEISSKDKNKNKHHHHHQQNKNQKDKKNHKR